MGSRLVPFLFTSLAIATLFSFFLIYSPNPLLTIAKQGLNSIQIQPNLHAVQEQDHQDLDHNNIKLQPPTKKEEEKCDLYKGHWVPELRGPMYTNSSCATIPESKNCFKNGRRDSDFLNWRWKPDKCELPLFDPNTFLEIVRGKKMAFIGDSVARNHVESLLCLLSQIDRLMERIEIAYKQESLHMSSGNLDLGFIILIGLHSISIKSLSSLSQPSLLLLSLHAASHLQKLIIPLVAIHELLPINPETQPLQIPKDVYKDSEDRFRTWYFPQHDFTLMKLWSKYLIAADERMVNGTGSGTFDLHLDRLDDSMGAAPPRSRTTPSSQVGIGFSG
ncbi:hypothetical protein GBA52_025203 [Prunus armeniaca]|nr:hypothetical protein GBA52_025203 [Prunus armeniaca]